MNPIEQLYNSLKDRPDVNLGTLEEFTNVMSNADARRGIYDAFSGVEEVNFGTYEQFDSLFSSKKKL